MNTETGKNPGGYISEGLPNITGSLTTDNRSIPEFGTAIWQRNESGALYQDGNHGGLFDKGSFYGSSDIYFDASRSNSIYGNSTHVTPYSYCVKMWKRTA